MISDELNDFRFENVSDRLLVRLLGIVVAVCMIAMSVAGLVIVTRLSPVDLQVEIDKLRDEVRVLDANRTDADKLLAVLHQRGAAVVGLDADGVIMLWSRGAEELFEVRRFAALGRTAAMFAPESSRSRYVERAQAAIRAREPPYRHKFRCKVQVNRQTINCVVDAWIVPNQMAIAIVMRDD